MSRFSVLPAALALSLAIPTVARAEDPHHFDRREHDRHDRPGVVVQQRVTVATPGPGAWRWHTSREADQRYRELEARRARWNDVERREALELEARQHRLDELRRIDAERERDRAERARLARIQLAAQFHAPPSPLAQEEFARYSQRKATLLRIKAVADAEGRIAESARASELLSLEEQRHAAWVSAHASY